MTALIILRFAPKFIDVMTFGIALHVVALLLLHRLVVVLHEQERSHDRPV